MESILQSTICRFEPIRREFRLLTAATAAKEGGLKGSKTSNISSTNLSGMVEKDPDETSLDARLDREYRVHCFFEWGPFFSNLCLFSLGLNLFCIGVLPGARTSACFCFCTVLWSLFYFLPKHVDQQKGTMYEEHAMNLFGGFTLALLGGLQMLEATDDSLASEEGRDANVSMVVLAVYFCGFLIFRISSVPVIYRRLSILIVPYAALKAPRFGTFAAHYEALAFFLTLVSAELIGNSIDEMQRRNFVLVQKSNRALLRETQARAVAVEALRSFREKANKEQEAKESAARMADSLLNHTLKNIMADGIASVELFEQSQNKDYLDQAKLSMKHGMWWTRWRQSLLLVCQGSYRPKLQLLNFGDLLLECVNGRQIDRENCDEWKFLEVRTDPILLSLAFENGLSNAVKHNRPGSSNPTVTARLIPRSDQQQRRNSLDPNNKYASSLEVSSTLEVVIKNHATPGATFISKDVEKHLFQEGTHGKPSAISSSDGIGLGHAKMMAELLGGTVSLRQTGETISYTIRIPTEAPTKAAAAATVPVPHLRAPPSPPPPTPESCRCCSQTIPTLQSPKQQRTTSSKPTRGMIIDDSLIARKYAGKVLFPKILGMKDSIILGENQAQLDLCVPFATAMNPDIIIIDENLELLVEQNSNSNNGHKTVTKKAGAKSTTKAVTGTQICRDLVAAGVDALLCIRSGNTSPEEVQKYIDAGAHCVICKSFDNTALAEPLLGGYRALRASQQQEGKQQDRLPPNVPIATNEFPILLLDS